MAPIYSILPCGKEAEGASKGYLPGRKGQRGRQLGRVYASQTEEIVADLLSEGHTHLSEVLLALIEQAQENLQLDEAARHLQIYPYIGKQGPSYASKWKRHNLLHRGF